MAFSNGTPAVDTKTAKKKKTKVEVAATTSSGGTTTPAGEASHIPVAAPDSSLNGGEGPGETAYLRDLTKNIRNIHKKLNATSKTESIMAENSTQSLDELVAAKKLNSDQRAQILKKPQLQAQLAQLEEQVTQFRKIEKEYEDRMATEKAKLVEEHQEELVKAKEEATAEASKLFSKKLDEDLLVLSQFLHAAAAKRQMPDVDTEEARAFEGALLLVYQGTNTSLTTLKNLIAGSEERVISTQGEPLDFRFAQIKQASIESAPEEPFEEEPPEYTEDQTEDTSQSLPVTDPTMAHAGLTELEDTVTIAKEANGTSKIEPMNIPEQASTGDGAANAVAESNWDAQASIMTNDSGTGEGWIEVPRDPGETDSGIAATPAAIHGTSSWAEEVTEGVAAEEKAAAENDGFEQVVHHPHRERGRGRGRGEFRGRGRGENYRGGRGRPSGDRGDGRGGRGRGGGGRPEGYRGGNRGGGGGGGRGRDGPAPRPAE